MRALTLLLALALAGLCGGVASAQDLPRSEHARRVAERYKVASWPRSGPEIQGWVPDGCKVPGWVRLRVEVDARRAEAKLDFARAREVGRPEAVEARITARRCESVKAAKLALLARLGAVTTELPRIEGLGEVAFAGRVGGRLVFLLGVRGDFVYEVRSLARDEAGQPLDVRSLAEELDLQLRRAQPKPGTAPKPQPAASLEAGKVRPAGPGQPIPVALEFKGSPRDVRLAAEGASALRTEGGCLIYPEGEGPLRLEVTLCDKELRVSRHVVEVR